jgi:hypothetical protein
MIAHLDAGSVDFGSMVRAWLARWRDRAVPFDSATDRALQRLAESDQPPPPGERVHSLVGLPLAVPAALATFRSPRSLLGTVYHTARLTTADESATRGAVAIGVATARFLLGHRDFIPDVVEALAVNGAPAALLAGIRRVPLLAPGGEIPAEVAGGDPAARAVVAILRLADREPVATRAVTWWSDYGGDGGHPLVASAALLGARDGADAVPAAWRPSAEVEQACSDLAVRLTSRDIVRARANMASPVDGPEMNT